MTERQQKIINLLSREIASALGSADHYYVSTDSDRDKIEAYQEGYLKRVQKLRDVRVVLENEFTTTMYDPR